MNDRSLPPLNWLRAFEAAARHLSFTAAARELNMTQSAVSQHIKSLETFLGQPLFYRRRRTLELTALGLNYLPIVKEAFSTLTRGTRMLLDTGDKKALRVQTNTSFSTSWLAPRLPTLYARHPDIHLHITTAIWDPVNYSPDADVEIRFQVATNAPPGFERLTWDHFYPVCAPDYQVTLDEIQFHRLFYCTGLLTTWDAWLEGADLANVATPRVTYSQILNSVLAAAEAGAGLAMAHDTAAINLLQNGRLRRPFIHSVPMQEAYYIGVNPDSENSADARNFAQWVRDEMAADQSLKPVSGRLATHA